MSHTRLRQLSEMYSFVTGVSQPEALRIIRSTKTGKKIENGSTSYLYDQQTSNLADIVAELPPDAQKVFTVQKIYQSMCSLNKPIYTCQIPAIPEFKHLSRKDLKKLQKKRLQIASASQIFSKKTQRREMQKHANNSTE